MTTGAAQVRAARSGVRIGGTGGGPALCFADKSKRLPEVELSRSPSTREVLSGSRTRTPTANGTEPCSLGFPRQSVAHRPLLKGGRPRKKRTIR